MLTFVININHSKMINLNNLYHIKKVISLELQNNMKTDLNNDEYKRLMRIQGELNVLIQRMEHGKKQ